MITECYIKGRFDKSIHGVKTLAYGRYGHK